MPVQVRPPAFHMKIVQSLLIACSEAFLFCLLRINFRALESALIDQPKVPKDQNDTLDDTLADKLIEAIKCDPKIKQDKLAEKFKVSVPSIKRAMKLLSDGGKIERKGGKRFGYWVVK